MRQKKQRYRSLSDIPYDKKTLTIGTGMSKKKQQKRSKINIPFNQEQLKHRCQQSVDALFAEGVVYGDLFNHFSFFDRGGDILVVAHCDCVNYHKHFAVAELDNETLIYSTGMDDRLGVYTALDLLPDLGIKADVLLTDYEERGRTTAANFDTDKQYKWIVEFDRTGTDAVLYHYDDHGYWYDAVNKHFTIGRGSFSDISEMEGVGCKAFNVGVGYHDPHSERAYMVVHEYISQMQRFVCFHRDYSQKRFEHAAYYYEPVVKGYSAYNNWYYDDEEMPQADGTDWIHQCVECGTEFRESDTILSGSSVFCPMCGIDMPTGDYYITTEEDQVDVDEPAAGYDCSLSMNNATMPF